MLGFVLGLRLGLVGQDTGLGHRGDRWDMADIDDTLVRYDIADRGTGGQGIRGQGVRIRVRVSGLGLGWTWGTLRGSIGQGDTANREDRGLALG